MEKTFSALGRTVIVAGVAPALLWLALNAAFFWGPAQPFTERVGQVVEREGNLALAISVGVTVAVIVGALLFALNGVIIHCYEGAYGIFRYRLFAGWQRRNEQRNRDLYGPLNDLRRMHDEAAQRARALGLDGGSAADVVEWQSRADAAALAVDRAHAAIETGLPVRRLPTRAELVTPTALGNAYAVMEEYPFERYGIDSMVFWPRLLAVLPADYQERIGAQKTTCDFLLHCSLLLNIFAVEALVATLFGIPATPGLPLAGLTALVLAYLLYRACVAETVVMGKLVCGAFDLYRRPLLRQFGLEPPAELTAERLLWARLNAFIRRGDAFYHPLPLTGPPAREGSGRGAGAGVGAGAEG